MCTVCSRQHPHCMTGAAEGHVISKDGLVQERWYGRRRFPIRRHQLGFSHLLRSAPKTHRKRSNLGHEARWSATMFGIASPNCKMHASLCRAVSPTVPSRFHSRVSSSLLSSFIRRLDDPVVSLSRALLPNFDRTRLTPMMCDVVVWL